MAIKKVTIQELNELAESKGGKCLSNEYLGDKTKLLWECSRGHAWKCDPGHIKQGRWCPVCNKEKRDLKSSQNMLHRMHEVAKRKGGECLSDKYNGFTEKYKWKCSNNHIWEAIASNIILKDTWCPKCRGLGYTEIENLKILIEIAHKKGGNCLSNKYLGDAIPLKWKCSVGHEWEAVPSSIKQGSWCRKCYEENVGVSKRKGLTFFKDIAINRGGKCLSTDYKNAHTKLFWECAEGHTWSATGHSINQGSWCPACNIFSGEEICRFYFEQIFRVEFKKCFPPFLKYAKGKRLELDGYNPEVKIAFEHQGLQHYKNVDFYHTANDTYEKVHQRDVLKKKLCEENDIKLVCIPSIGDILPLSELKSFLIKEFTASNIDFLVSNFPKIEEIEINYNKNRLSDLKEIAKQKGGECLSRVYFNPHTKLKFRCQLGHEWEATPHQIKNRNSWCLKCANLAAAKRLLTDISEIQNLAKQKEGECLSTSYNTAKEKLLWKCKFGHIWKAPLNNISQGCWCPKCVGRGNTEIENLEILRSIAKSKGGKFLSNEYFGGRKKYDWCCEKGHEWSASAENVKGGTWCPKCRGLGFSNEENLYYVNSIAQSKGGKCISAHYLGARNKIDFQCIEGHIWATTPDRIRRGMWCPICGRKKKQINHNSQKDNQIKLISENNSVQN